MPARCLILVAEGAQPSGRRRVMDNPKAHSRNGDLHARLEWTPVFLGLIAICLTLAPSIASDGAVRFSAVRALLGEQGSIQIKFSLVQPLLSMPLAWLAKLTGHPEEKTVAYFNLLVVVGGGSYLYKLAAEKYSPQAARISLLVLGSASMLPHHLQWYYGEVLTSIGLSIGVLCLERKPILSTLMFALGLVNTPALIPPFILVAVVYLWHKRGWQPIAGAAGALSITVLENVIKYGSLKGNPYLADAEHGFHTVLPYSGQPGFSYPLFFGLLSIVASFGKGLVFYIPGSLLFFVASIRKSLGGSALDRSLLAAFVVLTIALYAKWWAWYGGGFWGPRFFLFLCFPASLLIGLTIANGERRCNVQFFAVAVLLLSIWVGVDGYLFGQTAMDACWVNNFALEPFCWYTPEFSALWRPFVTGDIGGAWDMRRALFAFWQIFTGAYLIRRLFSSSRAQRELVEGNENEPGSY